ncbi:class I SAM-dependent methyltransferase [Desulfotomaculum copahuensis]|uniref:SAM-dependent methyltransferase n=1 Tax=Desulfotomaculum copahuensis TaxID=1838280 RepID=A0A1B7LH46_9FIRM|nr:SAM-dependent methyltransferase [Desulfotomaculum copahuensis]OAT85546.1 hypothetical protein A6M21_06170 [Desulfotomaculum copahuensis]
MSEKVNKLAEIIMNEIKINGPLTFARFMEMALYYPGLGYYTAPGEKIGTAGDYYTSSDVHPVFGAMLARQFTQMWPFLPVHPADRLLVEYGAGKGLLARDILTALREQSPEICPSLTYWIIERSPVLAARQRETLSGTDLAGARVRWAENLSATGGRITGCIFSNEVVDAFPVHRIRQTAAGLKEIYVTCRDGRLQEIESDPSTPLLAACLQAQGTSLETGQTAEINLAARHWLAEIASRLACGFLLTIDYGQEARELYHPSRFDGTMRCYHRHKLIANPYEHVGEQDITANVNFTQLRQWGEEMGLRTAGFTTQMNFLLNLGILETVKPAVSYVFDPEILRATMAIKKLIMPEGMGRDFKILCQYKGLTQFPELAGFNGKFGRSGR